MLWKSLQLSTTALKLTDEYELRVFMATFTRTQRPHTGLGTRRKNGQRAKPEDQESFVEAAWLKHHTKFWRPCRAVQLICAQEFLLNMKHHHHNDLKHVDSLITQVADEKRHQQHQRRRDHEPEHEHHRHHPQESSHRHHYEPYEDEEDRKHKRRKEPLLPDEDLDIHPRHKGHRHHHLDPREFEDEGEWEQLSENVIYTDQKTPTPENVKGKNQTAGPLADKGMINEKPRADVPEPKKVSRGQDL